jgi:hypothetical protein
MILMIEDKHNALMIIRTWSAICVEQTEQLGPISTVPSKMV